MIRVWLFLSLFFSMTVKADIDSLKKLAVMPKLDTPKIVDQINDILVSVTSKTGCVSITILKWQWQNFGWKLQICTPIPRL